MTRQDISNAVAQWQMLWGTPRGIFGESEGWKMEAAFVLAILFHAAPFGYLWQKQAAKKAVEVITLQNVDLIEPEIERPFAPPPPVQVQQPKSALDFLKMALPTLRKPEVPRDVALTPKPAEPKLAEPEKLLEKKMTNAPPAPEINLNMKRDAAPPKIADLAKIPTQRAAEPRSVDPALKLEEVGRRAVAPPPVAPSISMERAPREKAADVGAMPKISNIAQARQPSERLVERTAPAAYKAPSLPIGYQQRGASNVSLDQPREVVRAQPKPAMEAVVKKETKTEAPAKIEISKEKVKITGPLQHRKVLRSYVPDYPDWARARNIEADVAIRFNVSPAGDVRDNMVLDRSSGYTELDNLAKQALKNWKFSPLAGQDDQWGVITFRFLLD